MPLIIFAISISYLIGSIPTAYIFGRIIKGIDIRGFGSGNVGATNALRLLGKKAGITVLFLDVLKGFIAVFFIGNIIASKAAVFSEEILRFSLGLSCIVGHAWTIFLKFKGGKGIATTLGVFLGLAAGISGLRIILILLIGTWAVTFIITKIVSLSSILSAISLPLYMLIFRLSGFLIIVSTILCVFIILRHKSNLIRLFQGKEPRLNIK